MSDSSYVPIRVTTLRGDQKISFDAYVRVAGKFILYCRQGDSFEGDRLARLKSKKLSRMYITKTHEKQYQDYMNKNINNAYHGSETKPLEIRAQIIQGVQQAAAEDLMDDPANDAFYKVAHEGSSKFVEFFFTEKDSLKELLKIENSERSVAHHGVTVSYLALAIAEQMRFNETRPMQLPALVLGCMIHDIGQFQNPLNLETQPEELKGPDKEMYIKHCLEGFATIKPHTFYDETVKNIVEQHEENMDGSGYPNGLKEKDIDPMVFIAATANAFDRYISFQKMPIKDALKKMLIDKMGIYPLPYIKALQDALKFRGLID